MRFPSRLSFLWWIALFLLNPIFTTIVGADTFTATYDTGGGAAMTTGGTTTVTNTKVGHASYVRLSWKNDNAGQITVTPVTISNVIGCSVFWCNVSSGIIYPGNMIGGEIAFRPSTSAWSFKISVGITGDALSTFTQTFSDSGIPTATGPQLEFEADWTEDGHTDGSLGMSFVGGIPVGNPISVGVRLTNRSSLQAMTVTSPGWVVADPPVNCTVSIEYQPPGTLGTDESAFTAIRLTSLAVGAFHANIAVVTDGSTNPNTVISISATANDKPRLVFLNGTTVLGDFSTVSATATIGVAKNLQFTLRNDDIVPITFSTGLAPTQNNCTVSSVSLPKTTLVPGEETTWIIRLTTTKATWSFTGAATVSTPAATSRSLQVGSAAGPDVYVDLPTSGGSDGGSGGSNNSKCGLGSGLSAFGLLGLVGLMSVFRGGRHHTKERGVVV